MVLLEHNVLFLPKGQEKVAFSETLAGISCLTHWTACQL